MNDVQTVSPWWWMLAALLGVAVLMWVLRVWLDSRRSTQDRPGPHQGEQDGGLDVSLDGARAPLPPPSSSTLSGPLHLQAASNVLDPVTGLATRLLLEDKLAAAAMRAEARKRRLALLYIDLDGFKRINDTFGQVGGDALLREMGQRLLGMGRATDTIARLGADEFLMLLDGDPDSGSAALVAERIRLKLQQPCLIDGQDVRLSCSIGIVLYPQHGPRAKLIARADAAMMAAKRAGGNMHCFYDASMEVDADRILGLRLDLREAIESGVGLMLHYQPQIDARTGNVTGAEALLRWHHPVQGLLMPEQFVPIAERFGLIGALGQWALNEACRQMRVWLDEGVRLRVALNLSLYELRQAGLNEGIRAALAHHRVPAELLSLEINEQAAMEDAKAKLSLFEGLAQTGVHLVIDDFGTGYSSLRQLRKLPVGQLKIDVSFVHDMAHDEDARAVVRACIRLAHALGLTVLAEGVETPAQQALLMRWGCDQMQGHLFAMPMPAAALPAWLAGDQVPARSAAFRASLFHEDSEDRQDQAPEPGDQGDTGSAGDAGTKR